MTRFCRTVATLAAVATAAAGAALAVERWTSGPGWVAAFGVAAAGAVVAGIRRDRTPARRDHH